MPPQFGIPQGGIEREGGNFNNFEKIDSFAHTIDRYRYSAVLRRCVGESRRICNQLLARVLVFGVIKRSSNERGVLFNPKIILLDFLYQSELMTKKVTIGPPKNRVSAEPNR